MRRTPHVDPVLELIDQIPSGQALTYGDVAELTGRSSARGVGQILAHWGDEVAWWRVVNASGRPPAHHLREALTNLRAEGTPLSKDGNRVDLTSARWSGVVSDPADPMSRLDRDTTGGTAGGRAG